MPTRLTISSLAIAAAVVLSQPRTCLARGGGAGAVNASRIADAIYRIEGGSHTHHPYGILHRGHLSRTAARRICLATIRHCHQRWLANVGHAQRQLFLLYLADHYCPPQCDAIGNRNWRRNILLLVNHNTKPIK